VVTKSATEKLLRQNAQITPNIIASLLVHSKSRKLPNFWGIRHLFLLRNSASRAAIRERMRLCFGMVAARHFDALREAQSLG
jgi:hypothetical protein